MKARVYLSPSDCHYPLLKQRPSLEFRGGSVRHWQTQLRKQVRELIGWDQLPQRRSGLQVRKLWERDHPSGLGRISKVIFRSEPYADVPAYVCLPHSVPPPYRFMICLQGHNTGMHNSVALSQKDERTSISVEGERDFALGCLRNGFAALALEQRSFGERKEQKQPRRSFYNDCHDAAMRALMLGRTLLAERVYDVDRAIDYLQTRPDAAADWVGVMGNSGGGLVAIYAAALLPRISFAMPSCAFCTFRESFMSIHHCSDNYVPGLYRFADLPDVLGLFAPRPVVVVSATQDPIFPYAGARRAFRQLQRIYRAADAVTSVRLATGQGGHRFYENEAWRAAQLLVSQDGTWSGNKELNPDAAASRFTRRRK